MGVVISDVETTNDKSPKFEPGYTANVNHATYGPIQVRYVKNVSGAALADGDVVAYKTQAGKAAGYEVTIPSSVRDFAGVAMGAISDDYYGFIMTEGYHDAAKMAADTTGFAAGAHLIPTADGTVLNFKRDKVTFTDSGTNTVDITDLSPRYAVVLETYTSTATSTAKVYVHAGLVPAGM